MKEICDSPEIWKWFSADLSNPNDLEAWMLQRLNDSELGNKMTYAVFNNENSKIVGSTSYGHLDWPNQVIEIGWTWIGSSFIGKGLNKHMKYLMLSHAFERMDIRRVELRTDEINVRSRRAIEKIGGQLDGVLRSHRITIGGRRRNTVVYSILKEEWSDIRNTIFKDF